MKMLPFDVSALLLVLLIPGNPAHLDRTDKDCRCVPDRWQGEIIAKETEFQLSSGHSMTSFRGQSKVRIHYDYRRRLLATTDIDTGMKSIEDYAKGIKFTTDEENNCRAFFIGGTPMEQMCIPDDAVPTGEFQLGATHPVMTWQWTTLDNYTRTTIIDKTNCLPISEESFYATNDYVELVSYLYVNVVAHLKDDPEVFQPDVSCRLLDLVGSRGTAPQQQKRRKNSNM